MKITDHSKATAASSLLASVLVAAILLAPARSGADQSAGPGKSSLEVARSRVQENDLDGAAKAFAEQNRTSEPDRESLIQQGQVESWRGNYAKATELLELYRDEFGRDSDYLRNRARLLAWAELPDQAMVIVEELLKNDPGDFSALFSKAIAMQRNNQPVEALALAEELKRTHPSRDTEELHLVAWTQVRSHIGATINYYTDADDLDHLHSELFGVHFLSPVTSLGIRLEYDDLSAPHGSGLENVDGSENEEYQRGALELWHRFSPWLAADLSLGASRTGELEKFPTTRVNLALNPIDTLDLRLSQEYDYYLISPRSVSLGIRRSHYQAEANWRPDLNYTVVAQVAYDDFSDDNNKWLAVLSPRRAFLRSQHFNLDLGVRGWLFGFERDLEHGYYDPEKYQSYMVTAFSRWKIDRDNEIGLSGAAGMLKDDRMDSFEFGWDATLEGIFGIYRDWLLKAHVSAMENQRQNSGAYNATSGGLTLIRRF
ncbi:MAG TPA: hypothetical protein VLA15_10755 [Desulfurivibrionaceae bacterium]|nr:hypothetical protein [Desulfurivibrionaceae bacterium]